MLVVRRSRHFNLAKMLKSMSTFFYFSWKITTWSGKKASENNYNATQSVYNLKEEAKNKKKNTQHIYTKVNIYIIIFILRDMARGAVREESFFQSFNT